MDEPGPAVFYGGADSYCDRKSQAGHCQSYSDWLRLRLHPAPRPLPCNSVSSQRPRPLPCNSVSSQRPRPQGQRAEPLLLLVSTSVRMTTKHTDTHYERCIENRGGNCTVPEIKSCFNHNHCVI